MIMYLGSSLIFQWPALLPGKCMRVFQLEMFLSSFPTLENCMLEWHTFEWPTNFMHLPLEALQSLKSSCSPTHSAANKLWWNTAPDLNSMLAWTHTEEGPDILQSEKECWGLTPNTWKVPICLTRAFTELSRKAAMTGPTPRRATRWETTLCPHACTTGFPSRPASTHARSGWWRVVPAPDSPSH